MGEGVEVGEGGPALGSQGLGSVQHLRDLPLLRQRRQGDFELFNHSPSNVLEPDSAVGLLNEPVKAMIDSYSRPFLCDRFFV